MADTHPQTTPDYSTGGPRRHHSLYLEDGNFVIQVENAIFKILRSLLAMYSTVVKDMLDVPNGNESMDGTDEKPLILTGDSAAGWELLLGLQYDRPRVNPQGLSGEQMLLVLPIAHKYCMEGIEGKIIKGLRMATNSDGYVDLMVASQITGSEELHQAGLRGLISCGTAPSVTQAKRIGAEATHTVMTAVMSAATAALTQAHTRDTATLIATHTTAMATLNVNHASTVAALSTAFTTEVAAVRAAKTDNRICRHCHQNTNGNCSYIRCRKNQV